MPTKPKDETGKRYGILTVLEQAGVSANRKSGHAMWRCKCDCGNIKVVSANHLRQGQVKSCGCSQGKKLV